jgi:hypothetical protein
MLRGRIKQRISGRMIRKAHLALALGVILGTLLWATDAAAYEHRRGTPSFGVQGQFGITAGDSDWHELFDNGFGVSISVRQYIARDRAVGLTAQQQSFDRIHGDPKNAHIEDPTDAAYDKLQFQLLMVDYYAYFHRAAKRTPYVVASAGFYRPQLLDQFQEAGTNAEGEHVKYPGEGFLLRAGGGFEYFLARTLSIDSTLSGYFFSAPGEDGRMFTLEFALGLHLYTR